MNRSSRQTGTLLSLLLLSVVVGCATGKGDGWRFTQIPSPKSLVGLKKDEPEPPQMPTRLVSTWQDTVLNQVGQKSQRGFGGRVLFFNEASEDSIRVDGQLVVYAFDEDGRAAHETHPTRRYLFPAEQFARHESECKLGPSYSIWLPWDEAGGEQKNISLIARFEPKAGQLVAGDQTRHLLPGTRQLASGDELPPVEQVSNIRLTEFTQTSELRPPPALTSKKPNAKITSIALSQKDWGKRLVVAQGKQPQGKQAEGKQLQPTDFDSVPANSAPAKTAAE